MNIGGEIFKSTIFICRFDVGPAFAYLFIHFVFHFLGSPEVNYHFVCNGFSYSADKVNPFTSTHVRCGQGGVDRGVELIPR